MEVWQYLLLFAGGLVAVFCACLLPDKFFSLVVRMSLNTAAGLFLLLLLNTVTQLQLPLNGLTVAVSSLLGLPGMVAVAAMAAV